MISKSPFPSRNTRSDCPIIALSAIYDSPPASPLATDEAKELAEVLPAEKTLG